MGRVAAHKGSAAGQGRHHGSRPDTELARDQIAGIDIEGSPGWGYGLGFSVLRDSQAAGVAEPAGTWRWGGAYGHSEFTDPNTGLTAVALTNTTFEGMSGAGRFSADLSRAICAATVGPS
nr:serine hydrolase [Agrobacterium fabrum]